MGRCRTFDALVLDAQLRQALVTVRSLGRRGLSVAVLGSDGHAPALSSRWCRTRFVAPGPEGTERYLAYLEDVLGHHDVGVLIPSADGTIALLRRYRARLEQRVHIALADEAALSTAVDKARTLAVAERAGVCIPRSVLVSTKSDVPTAIAAIGLPAVVKPTQSWLWTGQGGVWTGCRLVTTLDEARSAVDAVTRLGGATLIQPFVSGRREAVSLVYLAGRIHARFAQWAKRTVPPLGGTSVLRQSIAVPSDSGDQAERLVRAIGLEGYSEVEFRRDHRGLPHLMEVNPRLSASVEIAVRSGVDFPALVHQWARGGGVETADGYRAGVWMRYLPGDVMTTLAALGERGRPGVTPPVRALLGFGASFFRPMRYDYVDWSDLRPVVSATNQFARRFVRAAVGKTLRRPGRQ
jgi:predicted ATP-grasp superfamily ATP-dependent carboligase